MGPITTHQTLRRGEDEKRTHIVSPQIRLELSRENLQRRTLSDTVRSNQSEHLSRSWRRQSMEFERVGGITMRHLSVEVGGEVDDVDSFKGTSRCDGGESAKSAEGGVKGKNDFLGQIPQPVMMKLNVRMAQNGKRDTAYRCRVLLRCRQSFSWDRLRYKVYLENARKR